MYQPYQHHLITLISSQLISTHRVNSLYFDLIRIHRLSATKTSIPIFYSLLAFVSNIYVIAHRNHQSLLVVDQRLYARKS